MDKDTLEEIRRILRSFREDVENAEKCETMPEQTEAKAVAVEAALACLLEALAGE